MAKKKAVTIPTWTTQFPISVAINIVRENVYDEKEKDIILYELFHPELILFLDETVNEDGTFKNVLCLATAIIEEELEDAVKISAVMANTMYPDMVADQVWVFDLETGEEVDNVFLHDVFEEECGRM